jgi:uroporphyrin-III C-methyltransferase
MRTNGMAGGNVVMEETAMGKVFLVGAGPGDPELLTLRAARLLDQADIVLHDALVTSEILAMISPTAKIIDIGKRCGRKLLTQAEINSLLISCAATAEVVVRLKGGDPCILGRAGEEIEALADAGIAFEIVPGVTSAIAGAAAAGISLTDRRFASSVVFTTAHRGDGTDAVEWDKLVSSNSTLAVYMPGSDYRRLSRQLREAGVEPRTPCMVISAVGRPDQQMLWTDIGRLAGRDPLPSPALVIVGRCAGVAREAEACRDWHTADTNASLNPSTSEPVLKGAL